MGLKYLGALFAGMLVVAISRALKSGVVRFGDSEHPHLVEKKKEPVSYWILIALQLVLFVVFAISVVVLAA